MLADDARKSVACRVLFAEQQILAEQLLLTRATLHKKLQMIEVDGLLQKVESPFLHRRDGFFHRAERGQKNHRNRSVGVLCRAQDVEARSAGHLQIGDDQQVAACANLLDSGAAVRRLIYGVAGALERFAEHCAQFIFIFNKQERFHLLRFYHGLRGEPEERSSHVRRRTTVIGCQFLVFSEELPGAEAAQMSYRRRWRW